jgi:gamma-D-glutamyl-L-lysine dipeptidyl-peptidase
VSAGGAAGPRDGAGIVGVGVAGLRREPAHAAELLSQALLGETFRVLGATRGGDWLRVRLDADGYEGWLRSWGTVATAPQEATAWAGPDPVVVAAREVSVRRAPQRGADLLLVAPWQARLAPHGSAGAWVEVGLPNGSRGYVPCSALAREAAPGGVVSGAQLVRTAERLLGTPYLWGGRSSWGFDCSGYVQAVYAWHGLRLPRDSRDQFGLAEKTGLAPGGGPPRPSEGLRAGSLLFFAASSGGIGHVALSTGGLDFLHAYGHVGRGSLNQESQVYVIELFNTYMGAWKPAF